MEWIEVVLHGWWLIHIIYSSLLVETIETPVLLLVEFLLVFGLVGDLPQSRESFVDVAIDHGAGDAEVFGNEGGRLVFQLYSFEDFELSHRDGVAEVLD